LPLKQKQIEQSKLEAQARKEATLQNAEAAAQAKIVDSKAEVERQKNLSEAEANRIRITSEAEASRIRVTAAADAERLKSEAAVLKQNPMLIQKIIAERLSDKLQIIMVPMDGKNFFASDVLRSAFTGANTGNTAYEDDGSEGAAPAVTASQKRRRQ
jgi:regulator of protease activity HflC (stomatin/prohibitin superfamily)